jgi:Mu-like prophage major head subunit gpT
MQSYIPNLDAPRVGGGVLYRGRWLPALGGGSPERAAHWSELLTPQLSEAFFIGFSDEGRRASLIETVYNARPSQRAFEEHLGVGVFGSDGWNFEDTGRVQYDARQKGFLKRFTHVEFAKGFVAQRKLIDDNLTDELVDDARELGDSAFRKREKGAASVFNNSFTDSGVNDDGMPIAGPDNVGLCSTAHPLSQDNPGETQANEGVLALSADNLGTTRQLHMALTDDRGDIMNVMPNQVLIPPELEDAAIAAGMSALEPDSANNAVNPQQGRFSYVVWHYLTDANAWWMIDSARRNRSLLWYDRIELEFGREEDFDTLQAKFRAYGRWSYGWRDYAWVFGQNPAGG